jgi:hypothetical protein
MTRHLLLLLFISATAFGQLVVNDPINTAVNSAVRAGQLANHLEVMRQWAEQLERLNLQLKQLEDQLAVQRRIRDVIGDPGSATLSATGLEATELRRTFGETLTATRRLADALGSLRRTADGMHRALDDRTATGRQFTRDPLLYQRYAAVERQADNFVGTQELGEARTAALQLEVGSTIEGLRTATTQAEVDKLQSRLTALNGQLAHVAEQRRAEAEKLRVLQILNENQAAKERQDLLERQLAEERETLVVVGAWQQSLKLAPTDLTRR